MISSVLSKRCANAAYFEIKKNCYLVTPIDEPEYVRIKFKDIPQEFVDKYNLKEYTQNGHVYFEFVKGCYGLP